ncbi:MAG: acyl-CoA thioesterase [Actinobacteria bacterium]|nr:acyl-CoA thioesterase [Actinomycetota bacterium]
MTQAERAEYTLSILVMPAQENSLGVMHGGHLMSWMDMAAWVVAARAVAADQTVLFKAVHDLVWSAPLRAGEVCSVTARLVSIGRTSLRVELQARAEDPIRNVTHDVCSATFTMVAVGRDGRAEAVRLA